MGFKMKIYGFRDTLTNSYVDENIRMISTDFGATQLK
jgi:hypothetical protein